MTSPSSHSTGYPTTTTDSNQSRAHPCTEQNFTLEEHLPLYEAKMVHHFDHRWASYQVKGGKEAAIDVSLQDKKNPGFAAHPRYWVAAREVRLRTANLPKGLLAALRDRNADLIVLAVCHLLFINRLRQESAGPADAAAHEVFPIWIEFIERHPVARSLAPTQMGLCENSPPSIQPLGPSYLPAEPLDKIKTVPRSSTAWYAVDPHALSQSFASIERYGELLDSVPPLRTEDEAIACAEELLSHASPRWLMGWRDIARSVDERTTIADIIPFAAVGDQFLLMYPATTTRLAAALLGTLNSYVFDFVARQKLGGIHLKYFTMKQTAILPPEAYADMDLAFLVPRVLELVYTGEDLRGFAQDCGCDGPSFRWEGERRFLLRCELDAAFFHLYLPAEEDGDWRPARRSNGCLHDESPEQLAELKHRFPTPRAAAAYILDTFPIVHRKDEQRHGEYRTKRTILEIYDAMQASPATGDPYRTPLTPPPADPSRCHPARTTAPVPRPPADTERLP